ncbi:DUF3450 domain-containing protein [Vibrio ulleungensis]|uniref:DUF3450 domain-containing protein n=1 Tax=Vibrio ulleungensis TaxID=2807619 RepID=A0ABS2HIK6_9VIBR|nr:DUF3450 domain-containing protein [Vibrio ulleungensis]MBM7036926.1 DUF3450 domain-containing protein [Vibrio ulleungensis]
MFKTPLSVNLRIALSLLITFPTASSASDLDEAKNVLSKTNTAAATSQQRIDTSAQQSIQLSAEIEQLQQEVDNLQVYQGHLNALVESQTLEMASLEGQLDQINATRQGVVPLMYKMIEALKLHVEQDIPLNPTARQQRIARLDDMMPRADISDAEKYRRILEAYQIELEYGVKLGLYQGQILAGDQHLEVDVLHLGRLSLVARSLNGQNYWSWDTNNKEWQPLDLSMKTEIDKAYSIASQQIAPSMITLPLSLVSNSKIVSNTEQGQ